MRSDTFENDPFEQAILLLRSREYADQEQGRYALYRARRPETFGKMIELLEDENFSVRWAVVQILGYTHDPRAVDPLIGVLENQDDDMGAWAAWALGQIGGQRALEALLWAVKDGNRKEMRQRATEALTHFPDRHAIVALIDLLKQTPNSTVALLIGNSGYSEAVELLMQALETSELKEDKHNFLAFRYSAVRALGKLGDARALPLLRQIEATETKPVFGWRSVGFMAASAIRQIEAGNSVPDESGSA